MPVSVELLDSMVNPAEGKKSISVAEGHFYSTALPDRVRQLTTILVQLNGVSCNISVDDVVYHSRMMLAAVLLRKDIGALAGSETLTELSNSSAVALMKEIVDPLMKIFLDEGCDDKHRRQIGYCVVEVCSSLSILTPTDGHQLMNGILARIEPGCLVLDVMCFQLLREISERCPAALWSVASPDALSSLFRTTDAKLQQPSSCSPQQLEAIIGALCHVGIAYEKAKRVLSPGCTKNSEIEKAIFSQLPATVSLLENNSPVAHIGKKFVPAMLNALVSYATPVPNQVDVILESLSSLLTCSSQCPSLLAGDDLSLAALINACMKIAQVQGDDNEFAIPLKLSSLEVLDTILCVPHIKSFLHCDRESSLLQFLVKGDGGPDQKGVLQLCAEIAVMGVVGDEEDWLSEPAMLYDNSTLVETEKNSTHAECLLESFIKTLGGFSTLPHIFQLVDTLLVSPSWRSQRAVLSILEKCLSAAPVTFIPHTPAAVSTALRLTKSTSPRVQYQALQLIGALCNDTVGIDKSYSDSEPVLVRELYGGSILENIAHLIKSPCTKVASAACLSIVSYCRGGCGGGSPTVPIEKSHIVPYIGDLLEALRSGPLAIDVSKVDSMPEGSLTVLIHAVGAVACLADVAQEEFLSHYSVMNKLKACALFALETSQDGSIKFDSCEHDTHEITSLRGVAIEAASIVGQAVVNPDSGNVNVYAQDASDIMNLAISILNREEQSSSEIVPMDQLLAACARVASVMGAQYIPLVPSVLPHLIKRASGRVEVSIIDDVTKGYLSSGISTDEDEGYSLSIPGMGFKKIKINTVQLEEKAQAARAFYEHARALGKHFAPFVEASVKALLPLVKCEYSGDVRSTSSQALAQIFKSACLYSIEDSYVNSQGSLPQSLLLPLTQAFTNQLSSEADYDDLENCVAIADALSEIMYDAFTHKTMDGMRVAQISSTFAEEYVPLHVGLLNSCLSRRAVILSRAPHDSNEKVKYDEMAEGEAEVMTHLMDSIGYQLKSLGEKFTPIFAQHLERTLRPLLTISGTSDVKARFAAISLFDDCVEYCGQQAAIKYAPMLLEGIVEGIDYERNEGDSELQQVCTYGIVQIARHAPGVLSQVQCEQLLKQVSSIARKLGDDTPKDGYDYPALIEYAVSSIAALALMKGSPLDSTITDKSDLVSIFLKGLPIRHDDTEAQLCHMVLCSLVELGQVDVKSHYSTLMGIIGGIFALFFDGEEVATKDTFSRLVRIIEGIQKSVKYEAFQSALSSLKPNEQKALLAMKG